jgi:hypothetical protein
VGCPVLAAAPRGRPALGRPASPARTPRQGLSRARRDCPALSLAGARQAGARRAVMQPPRSWPTSLSRARASPRLVPSSPRPPCGQSGRGSPGRSSPCHHAATPLPADKPLPRPRLAGARPELAAASPRSAWPGLAGRSSLSPARSSPRCHAAVPRSPCSRPASLSCARACRGLSRARRDCPVLSLAEARQAGARRRLALARGSPGRSSPSPRAGTRPPRSRPASLARAYQTGPRRRPT